ncbi:MAG: MaoC family dehydratase [Litoreibacter sp.]|nr:MaoC family dehydratase [Litoreibacter sp.]
MSKAKTNPGWFFEEYSIGQVIEHGVPRTVSGGERAMYHALYPARHALYSSDAFAQNCGLAKSPMDDLIAFHIVFGKTVPDISLNAVANLGYGEGRFLAPVHEGDTLTSRSEVIGLKQNSNGKTGVVWVLTSGQIQRGDEVLSYVRWVMGRKRDLDAPSPETVIPELGASVAAWDLILPEGLDFSSYDFAQAGEPHRLSDYEVGEKIDHVDGVTVEEAEHMLATRLWQNTAKVHFDATVREDGKRLIYGGHVISMARALSFNGLANAQMIVGLNAGAHANPCFSGDTIKAWSEVLEIADTPVPSVGAIRLRLVAQKADAAPFTLKTEDGKHDPKVFLDLDYWALMPR